MPKLFRYCSLTLLISLLHCQMAYGDLVLTLDTTNETVSLSGATTGIPNNGVVSWLDGSVGFGGFGAAIIDLSGLLTANPANAIGSEHQLNLFVDTDFVLLELSDPNSSNSQVTFSGIGPSQSVSYVLTGSQSATLEGLIGSSLVLDTGSGFEAVSIVSSVPEPSSSTFVLFASMAATACFRRRALAHNNAMHTEHSFGRV